MEFLIIIIAVFIGYMVLSFKMPGFAIVTSPIASFACAMIIVSGLIGWDGGQVFGLTLALLIVPVVIFVIRFLSPEGDGPDRWPRIVSVWIFRLIGYLVLLVLLTGLFNIFGLGMWFLFVVFVWRSYMTYCRAIEMDIVSTIGACMRQNLPLATAMDSAAASYPRKRSRIFQNISKWLTQGYSLSESLKRGYPRCPAYITSTVTAGEALGQLPEAIRSIEAEIAEKADDTKKVRTVQPMYPLLVLTVVVVMTLGLMIFIIPTFAEVLSDMGDGARLPSMTQVLLDISHWLLGRHGLNAFLAVIVPLFLVTGFGPAVRILGCLRRKRTEKESVFSAFSDFIKWHLPFLHWFEMNYSLMRLAAILRVGIVSGHPVDDAISEACRLNVNSWFRRRIRRWLKCVQRGDNISSSALKCGIGHSLAWAFDEEINAGNTPGILRMLENFCRENYTYRLNIARAVFGPFVILLLGGCVGFVAFAMFLPIIRITSILTESVVP